MRITLKFANEVNRVILLQLTIAQREMQCDHMKKAQEVTEMDV